MTTVQHLSEMPRANPAAEDEQSGSGEGHRAASSQAARLLADLSARAKLPRPDVMSDRLPHSSIRQEPTLFQMRPLDPQHVRELADAIKVRGEVEPVIVVQVGPDAVLIEGHHRMAAYEMAKATSAVPVVYFSGTLDDAVLEAGRANTKTKLPVTAQQRADYAWRLTCMGTFTKAEIVGAANVSEGTVATMRRVAKALGDAALECPLWWQARSLASGRGWEGTPEEVEQLKKDQAQRYADRLRKEFGGKLSGNPELAAMALSIHFGRRLGEVYRAMRDELPEDTLDDAEGDF